ncbi:MAG: hypothetical protein AMS22_16440 [Thiotrichales bacterium SG8_50]|nr:MAG: hypothetical protein AMS22_16440 [Thiotrichales bacterium SG8_50]
MIRTMRVVTVLLVLGSSVLLTPLAAAQDVGETVVKRGLIKEDVYAAGENVTIDGEVLGDVVVAGGEVNINGKVSADVIAAGGQVQISADIGDDVRVAGGQLTVNASIGDDLIAAGGEVTVGPDTTVKGRTWLAGGDIEVAGRLGRELKVAGGSISISARVDGDVELMGDSIRVEAAADIRGDLVYRSDDEIYIDEKANITGSVVRKPMLYDEEVSHGGGVVMSILSIFVSVMLLAYLFPVFLGNSVESLRTRTGKSLLLGLVGGCSHCFRNRCAPAKAGSDRCLVAPGAGGGAGGVADYPRGPDPGSRRTALVPVVDRRIGCRRAGAV